MGCIDAATNSFLSYLHHSLACCCNPVMLSSSPWSPLDSTRSKLAAISRANQLYTASQSQLYQVKATEVRANLIPLPFGVQAFNIEAHLFVKVAGNKLYPCCLDMHI